MLTTLALLGRHWLGNFTPVESSQQIVRQRRIKVVGNLKAAAVEAKRANGGTRYCWHEPSNRHSVTSDGNLLASADPLEKSREMRFGLVHIDLHNDIVD